jgi:alcohol dehydrogenase class IV
MWFFNSPEIVYGEDALGYLDDLKGRRALIVTDPVLHELGFTERISEHLRTAGLEIAYFAEVEPEPALETVYRGAAVAMAFAPDWIVGLGGGSAMDAAKIIWALYERPDLQPGEISPMVTLGLGQKARLLNIPTTAGTGAEVTFAAVITDSQEGRKMELPSRELMASLVIVDPALTAALPRSITAGTGIDVLTHAVDAYLGTWHNDFTDGLCLKACQMVFAYLPRVVAAGSDAEAREKMMTAATIAGLSITNAHIALTHALGHALGAVFHHPHGRCVGMFLPYFVEYEANGGTNRVADIAYALRMPANDERAAGAAVAGAIRGLLRVAGLPISAAEMGIGATDYEANLDRLCDLAENDTSLVTTARGPSRDELLKLFRYAYAGKPIDF